jgi:galactokinase
MPGDEVVAFAPGRVNVIGEHTDHNDGLSLPFAVEQGVTVRAQAIGGDAVEAVAGDLGESDRFALGAPGPAGGWRAYVRGVVAELRAAGLPVRAARLTITSDLPRGAGLASSAALEVALCLALLGLSEAGDVDRVALAQLCRRVEHEWAGAQTGLLDQLASLHGAEGSAVRIDFRTLDVRRVPLALGGWRFATLGSGVARAHAASGYNERRAECAAAAERLGVASLRDAPPGAWSALPEPLARRARHVEQESSRVDAAVAALARGDLPALGRLLDASHGSLRDLFDASTPEVERAVERMCDAGAAGARMIGGGFGGHVLGLFAPGDEPPDEARIVAPGAGARVDAG